MANYLANPKPKKEYTYGNIEISLENCILPEENISETPSMKDGLDKDIEIDLRILGCEYIQTAGILLKLPQVAMATGQVLLQRFYYSKSLVKHDVEICAMASIFLAAKIEEAPRRIRDVINVFHHIKLKRSNRTPTPMDYFSQIYFTLKNSVIKAERRLLKELGFCVHVKHPHKIVITYLQILECEKNRVLAQKAWNYMNDSLRTDVFVRFSPEKIACGCIFLAARVLKVVLPTNPPWWELFDAELQDVEEVALTLVKLYARPKKSLSFLENAVSKVKKLIQAQKDSVADGKAAGSFTPARVSPANTLSQPLSNEKEVSPSTISPSKVKSLPAKDSNSTLKSNGSSNKTSPVDSNQKLAKRKPESYRSPVEDGQGPKSNSESDSDSGSSQSAASSPGARDRDAPSHRALPNREKHRTSSYSDSDSEPTDAKNQERVPKQYRKRTDTTKHHRSHYRDTSRNGHSNSKRELNDRSRSPRRRERSRSRSRSRDRKARKREYQSTDYHRKSSKHRGYDYENESRSHSSNYNKYDRKGKR